jgi:activator of the mannose operon, transcriptional antiterminator
MNARQTSILKLLLENHSNYLSSQQIADQLNCSEKTVRNDSKVLDEWLSQHSQATLSRKTNGGFHLEISETERNKLLSSLFNVQPSTNQFEEKERLVRILQLLLIEKNPLTIQKLSELFYVNKAVIKKDIEKIETFLARNNLSLTTKRKLGIEVEGNEQNWRLAISKIPSFIDSSRADFFAELFASHEIKAVQQTLEEVNQTLANPFTDDTIENLVIHILISIKRLKMGNSIPLPQAEVAKITKENEYRVTKTAMKRLEHDFAIHFPENEIAYIALHFMGGKVQRAIPEKNVEMNLMTQNLIRQISNRMHIDFSQDHDLLLGLQVHLQSSLNRIKHGLSVTNPILDQIKRMYPYLFDTIMNELVHIKDYQLPEEEAAYLTLHFQASLERLQKKDGSNKKAIIVCPMGIGASVLLRTKLERKFHSLEIVDSVSLNKVSQYTRKDIDFIISTVPLPHSDIPVMEITPLLSAVEEKKLQSFIEDLNQDTVRNSGEGNFPFLKSFLKKDLILLDVNFDHRYEVIESLALKLVEKGMVAKEYIESAIIREQHSSTSIGGGIAIPHGDPTYIKKSGIAVGVLKRPLLWGKEYVSLVLLLATKQEEYSKTKELFNEIGQLCDQPQTVNNLMKQKSVEDFINNLETVEF